MQIRILTIGKTKSTFYREAMEHYIATMPPLLKCTYEELKDCNSNAKKEGEHFLKALEKKKLLSSGKNHLILLDDRGKKFSSTDFAKFIESKKDNCVQNLIFLIGGAYGFSQEFQESQNNATRLSLSPMTFPHELARLILCEQIYRALHILSGSKYHH